jgi:hypothetical protein
MTIDKLELLYKQPWNYIRNYNFKHENLSVPVCLYTPLLDLGRFSSFLIFYTVGRTPWTGDQSVARTLPAHRTVQTQNKHTQTSMPWVGFEPTIPMIEPVKTVHALDRSANVTDTKICTYLNVTIAAPK